MKKILGLDIGISSVGWGVFDQDSGEIIDAGVRLFEEAGRNANEERRSFRGSRRLKRRRAHRLERAKELFSNYDLPLNGIGNIDPYQARYDAIYHSVTNEALTAALYHLIKMRGTILDSPENEKDGNDNELSTKQQIAKNKKLLVNQFVCEIQLERQENGEKIRSHQNRFRTKDYLDEASAIINKQRGIHKEIDNDEFIANYLSLIEQRREYYEGPGSRKSPTPYGSFFINDNGEIEEISMIDKMRGKCTYFPNELRVAKKSVTADLFNLLSGDLNKLQIEGEYLTYEDKRYLIENLIKKGKNITLKQILKYKGYPNDADVSGCRVDLKGDKPLFTEFQGYKEIKKIVEGNNLPFEILEDIDLMDNIAEILTAEKAYHRRETKLNGLLTAFDAETTGRIIDAFKESTSFTGYHALSKKAMDLVMNDLWHTNKNQMELFSELGLEEKRLAGNKNKGKISFDDTAILSTVAKRAHREAIKIVNAVREKYGELHSIVVETAREKNSDEQRKNYKDFQKQAGKFEKEMAKLLGVKSLAELKLNSKQHLALKLLKQQNWQCIYSGNSKQISPWDVVNNPTLIEIDHIIPVSISFDDSQANKVVCLRSENQKKGQSTPYQYFISGEGPRTFEEFKVDVLNLFKGKGINRKKKDYLLEMRDVKYNEELQKEFINRNLVDTQYAMRSFSMNLRSFFKANDVDTTVLSIRGSFTAALRRHARLNKDRDESYAHHAIDALIVAAIGRMPIFKFFNKFDMDDTGAVVDRETGEILEDEKLFDKRFITFLSKLRNYESEVKYSHKVDRKANRSLSNQTIYGTRKKSGEKYTIGKFKDIYSLNKDQVKPLLKRLEKKPDDFFISKYNPEVMETVQKVIKEYKTSDNPFKAYYEEHGYIMKDGKVPVKTLKYYDLKLGVHMDISQNYPGTKNDVVLKSIKGVRVDIYQNDEGKYKYLGVPYHWFKQQGDRFVLDMERYNEEKQRSYKKIDDTYEFQFSLYKNDMFSFVKDDEKMIRVFRGDTNPRQNKIEVDYIYKRKEKQVEGTFAPSTFSHINKYNVDILGNTYKVEKELFKNYLQL
ncbi:type II CRISPR RNA-guided endonuclease Cas9 [Lentibacillus sp. Marseille-P4043]|uniref:type II CRISPR RNA-guided endonuclease Cas9 n=1 Tax=Lentibacillus sp. Marseille-P4043 TaxID=2040293 RepID=UPI000D0B6C0C|nr:type II CRISPR RNA-guided endonuclease Cas9 [Lentibacillus sp. Marseille-P4043]